MSRKYLMFCNYKTKEMFSMSSEKFVLFGSIFSIICLLAFVTSLGCVVQYQYIPQRDNLENATCTIDSCDVSVSTCSYRSCSGSGESIYIYICEIPYLFF